MKTFLVKIQKNKENKYEAMIHNEEAILELLLIRAVNNNDIMAYSFKELSLPKLDEEKDY